MKKILSFMLVLSMLFSMVSFAIPVAVEVESAAEVADIVETTPVSDDAATLSAEGDLPAADVFVIDFEDQEVTPEGQTISMGNYSGFPQSANGVYSQYASWYKENPAITLGSNVSVEEETVGETTNKYVRLKDHNTSRNWFVYNVFLDNGFMAKPGIYTYTVRYKADNTDTFNLGSTVTEGVTQIKISGDASAADWEVFSYKIELKEGETISKLNLNFKSKDQTPFVQGSVCLDDLRLHYEPFHDEYGYEVVAFQDFETYDRTPDAAAGPITIGDRVQLAGIIHGSSINYFSSKSIRNGTFPVLVGNGGSYVWNNQANHKMSFAKLNGSNVFIQNSPNLTGDAWNYYGFCFANGSPAIIKPGDYMISYDAVSDNGIPSDVQPNNSLYQPATLTGKSLTRVDANTATVKVYFTVETPTDVIKHVGTAVKYHGTQATKLGIDNVRLWYREPAVAATVTFDANGVEATSMPDTYVGKTYDELDLSNYTPTADGMRFVGWSKTSDGDVISKLIPLTAETKLYAIWDVESTLTFNANGVVATVPAAATGIVGTAFDLSSGYTATTDDETKTFLGWSTSPYGEVVTAFTPTKTAHILYAIWETAPAESPYPASGVIFFEDFEDHTEAQTVLTVGSNAEIKPYWATNINNTTSGVVMYGPGGSTSNSNMTLEIDAATGNKYYGINYDSKYWYLYFNFGPDNAIAAPGDYVLSFDVIQSRNAGFNSIGFGANAYPTPAETKLPVTGTISAVQNVTAPYVHRATVNFTLSGDSWNGEWQAKDFRRSFQIQGTMKGTGFYGIDNVRLEYVAPEVSGPAPTTIKAAQIRTDSEDTSKQGMRYAAYIETAVEACEYGFIVSRESLLITNAGKYRYDLFVMDDSVTRNGTVLSGRNAYNLPIVGAIAITDTGSQTIYSTIGNEFGDYAIDDGLYFTTVLTGIDTSNKAQLTTRFMGRPYVKLTDGTYVHGEIITRSIYDVAVTIYEAQGDSADQYIKDIIATVEG